MGGFWLYANERYRTQLNATPTNAATVTGDYAIRDERNGDATYATDGGEGVPEVTDARTRD